MKDYKELVEDYKEKLLKGLKIMFESGYTMERIYHGMANDIRLNGLNKYPTEESRKLHLKALTEAYESFNERSSI